ncbi:DUF4097 family beta strand repeat-containing protein [Leucobacter chromiireducens]|uniref:DUF4097 family beta strand repeat-containing protein n=1 Tax=Leucobacter chromiireducens TaxID=283877 RepID=UPI000F63A468|nr:DUF4097 family beta strand repeat-containing protein [Leucobacter chromiireducens]
MTTTPTAQPGQPGTPQMHTPAAPVPPQGPSGPRRRGMGPVAIVTAVLGGAALLAVGASAASAVIWNRGGETAGGATASARGITELELRVGAADFTLAYGAVSEAELTARGAQADRVSLRRDGETLVLDTPDRLAGGSCWFGFCPPERRLGSSTITLTLPEAFRTQALDLDLKLAAGNVTALGNFGEVDVEVGAGRAEITGAARSLDVNVGVGQFVGELRGVRAADFEVSLGDATAILTGDAPDKVDVETSLGSVSLTLPDAEYRVDTTVTLGDVTNKLRTSPSSPHTITANVSAGDLTLRSAS